MQKCSECKKNTAILYISTTINGKPAMKGLCLNCAKKYNIPGFDETLRSLGIDIDSLDEVTENFNNVADKLDTTDLEENMGIIKDKFKDIRDLFEKSDEELEEDPIVQMANEDDEFDDYDEEPYEPDDYDSRFNFGGNYDSSVKTKNKPPKMKTLKKFGTDLNQLARSGKIDKIIGREKEISRLIQILNRRTKNNPILIGEAGVGKTAIAEGLALKIVEKKVPEKLKDCIVIQLDMPALVAGTQFRGQFESRMKNIISEASQNKNIILVVDEIHNLIGAGEVHGGTMDAANILKPALARGDLQIIGATTIDEFKKSIEKDSALERRFQSILVEEPSKEDSYQILEGIKDYYEKYHKVIISSEVIKAAVDLSDRYITERYLPDKAIDLIDEAGSKTNLKNQVIIKIQDLNREIQETKAKELEASEDSDYEKAAEYKTKEIQLKEELEDLKPKEYIPITVEDVAEVVEEWTGIPVKSITKKESQKLMELEDNLKSKVIGQDKAVEAIAKTIRRNRAGLFNPKKPASFIFVGPTGVGKTHLVKKLAKELFGSEDDMIRIDMSEYMEKYSASKLIGAPPGYVGHEEGGQLTDKIRRKPYSIVLLDEIEKAHSDVFNILLQILDDGRLTDSQGRTASFENSVIIMTSNIGTSFKTNSMGFGSQDTKEVMEKDKIMDSLKEHFKPEFLNRIDDTIVFEKLDKTDLRNIIDLLLKELTDSLKEKGIHLLITDDVKEFILEKGYDQKYGARPLKRTIQQYIENEISELFIKNSLEPIDNISAKVIDKKLKIEKA